MTTTKIEWTNKVWNPVTGCTKVSQGCKHCYAEVIARRFWATQYEPNTDGTPRKFTDVRLHPERLEEPLRWRKPARVFVNSMSDLFHEDVPINFIARVFDTMAAWRLACRKTSPAHDHDNECYEDPSHIFQILTKRPMRMYSILTKTLPHFVDNFVPGDSPLAVAMEIGNWPLPNVWLGVSAENQQAADERIPWLLKTPAAVRFVSAEPLLGPVDLEYALWERTGCDGAKPDPDCIECGWQANTLDWVIVGGESGKGARPMHPDWARDLRDQCTAAGVPFFFKQWGEYTWNYFDHPVEKAGFYPERVGKKAAGRLLDGQEWNQFPGGDK